LSNGTILPRERHNVVWTKKIIEVHKYFEGNLSSVKVPSQRELIKPVNTAGKEIVCQRF
jgi:hypothetical protein